MSEKSHAFALRVLRSKVLRGLEVMIFWDGEPGAFVIRARHPYGPWHALAVFRSDGSLAESENGSPVTSSDVAMRLRRALRDKSQTHFRFLEKP